MQEIKFRGQRIDNGEWIYGYGIIYGEHYGNTTDEEREVSIFVEYDKISGLNFQFIEVIPKTVGQYINIEDENGKEMYKGDWIKWNEYFFRVSYDYLNGYWYGEPHINNSIRGKLAGRSFPDSKIIDNISDNPELKRTDNEKE